MKNKRVIPLLLLRGAGLVKGVKFQKHRYVGDPINAVKIFNDKEVDELMFLDISARESGEINFELLGDICSEAFMPFSYGGGITSCHQIENLFRLGVEKVVLNSELFVNPQLVREAVAVAGSQSIVACVDVRKSLFGKYEIYANNGRVAIKTSIYDHLQFLVDSGVGEVVIQSIDLEGTGKGLDVRLIDEVSKLINIPVVASGGMSDLMELEEVLRSTSISAVAVGSLFIFHGKHKAVLITYPNRDELMMI